MIAEIDGLIQKLYEDNARGKLSDDRSFNVNDAAASGG